MDNDAPSDHEKQQNEDHAKRIESDLEDDVRHIADLNERNEFDPNHQHEIDFDAHVEAVVQEETPQHSVTADPQRIVVDTSPITRAIEVLEVINLLVAMQNDEQITFDVAYHRWIDTGPTMWLVSAVFGITRG